MSGRLFISLCAVLFVGTLRAQQVEPRIAGLEANAEYMSLLREDAQLRIREDSIVSAVEKMRQQLRDDPDNRQRYGQEILQLENKIFEVRNAKGRLVDKINAIEQDWVLNNLNKTPVAETGSPQGTAPEIADSLKVRNLIDNFYFREHLPVEDYKALRKAQQLEQDALGYVNRYLFNYGAISELADAYAAAQVETEAIEIYGKLDSLQRLNHLVADSLAGTWSYIFDNKSYAYSYLLDGLGREDILSKEEEQLAAAVRRLATLREDVASESLADYFLRKKVMTDFETSVAEALGLEAAQDSLRGVAAQIGAVDFNRPRIEVPQRYFIDYDTLSFPATPKYTAQNPIPECRVFAKGTVYRIQLGTFSAKRPVSVFRGVVPLCYDRTEEGKWRYFAGGFATREEADAALKVLKSKGFLRPEIAVWTDGEYRNLSRAADAAVIRYRVEIVGVPDLSEAVKTAIAETAGEYELSRVGAQMFVVGLFDDKGVADQVAAAVRQADGALEIKVAEITE